MSHTSQTPDPRHRPVRSYHQRKGQITATQQRGLREGWPKWGLDLVAAPTSFADLCAAEPVVLDIGFGMGESVLQLAKARPDIVVVGLEVHERGLGQLLAAMLDDGVTNVRVASADAAELLRDATATSSLEGVRLFFPDPWPKARHHKRRLVQPRWANDVARALKPEGYLYCATDWVPYAEHMLTVLDAEPALVKRDDLVTEFRKTRPTTRYETMGLRRGHAVTDLVYLKSAAPAVP